MLSRSQIAGARLVTVLVLTVRGTRYRVATRSLSATNTDPTEGASILQIAGGLTEPDIVAELEPGDGVGVEVLVPQKWHAEIIAGLADATGELCQIREGDDWQDRVKLVRGSVLEPVYGDSSEPLSFTLSSDPWSDRALLPLSTWQVTASTWPRSGSSLAVPESTLEQWYPVVFGEPGATLTDARAVPALLVELDAGTGDNSANDATVLLCVGDCTCIGGSVTLYNDSQETSATVTPEAATDALGQPVVVAIVPAATLAIADGDELWWCPTAGAGGLRSPGSTSTMRGAGDIVAYLLGLSTVPVATDRMQAAIAELNRYTLDFYLNDPVSPLSVVVDQIAAVLPFRLVADGAEGVYPVAIRWNATSADATWVIDPSTRGGYRSSPVSVGSVRDVASTIRLDFAPDAKEGGYHAHITAAPTTVTDDPYQQPHPRCRAAATRWPGERISSVETGVIADLSSAVLALECLVAQATDLTETVEVVLPQEYQAMQPGDVALVTLTEVGWSARVCQVVRVPRIEGQIVATFQTLPDWIRRMGGE